MKEQRLHNLVSLIVRRKTAGRMPAVFHPQPELITRWRRSQTPMMPGASCSSVLRLAFVLLCAVAVHAEDLETHWRKAKLAESGRVYWWRPSLGSEDDPEVSFTMPADAWRKGQLDDGSDYLWRLDPYGQQHRWSETAFAHPRSIAQPACLRARGAPTRPGASPRPPMRLRLARAARLPERGRGGALAPAPQAPSWLPLAAQVRP